VCSGTRDEINWSCSSPGRCGAKLRARGAIHPQPVIDVEPLCCVAAAFHKPMGTSEGGLRFLGNRATKLKLGQGRSEA
jgi:hypothetical protein